MRQAGKEKLSAVVLHAVLACAVACTALAQCAWALDPALDVSQYAHTVWRDREGFARGAIYSIAQTPDGYLWLGTEFGLLRFDGVRAVPWQPPAGKQLPSNAVESLLVARDGTLWIGTWKGLVSWKDGKLKQYPELAGLLIMALVEDRGGTVWAGGFAHSPPGKLCAMQDGTVHCYGEDGSLGEGPVGLYEDRTGSLWAGVLNGLWRWKPGPPQFYPLAGGSLGIQGLAEGDDGALLIAMPGKLAKFVEGKSEMEYPYPGAARRSPARPFLRDRDGGLWIGTTGAGLVHMHRGISDAFAKSDGLSSNAVTALFQDREGTVWVGTAAGLDRFRDLAVATLSQKQGLFTGGGDGSVLQSRDGSVWLAALDGLRRWSNGQLTFYHEANAKVAVDYANKREVTLSGLGKHQFASLFEDDRGRIWVAADDRVGYLENDRFISIRGVPGGVAYSIVGDTKGNLWIANLQRGLLRLRHDSLLEQIPWAKLGHKDHASALAVDPSQGGLWLGFYEGGVAYLDDGQVRAAYTAADGLGQGHINDLRLDQDGTLWAATQGGLSRIRDGRVATLAGKDGLPCDTVHWSIEDDDHLVWLYMPCGLVRIARSDLDAWVKDSKSIVETAVFDASDGVSMKGDSPSIKPSVAKSADGRLWFTTYEGISVIDPRHLPYNKVPPPVHVEQITADRKSYDPAAYGNGRVPLPARTRDLDIDYTALSLAVPEKVLFRYKLEGRDTDWQDAGNRRQAFYSDLPPRNYRFRVMACNNSGVWNEAGAFLDFSIAPAYYQTNWFRALCVAAFLVLLWVLYMFRLQQIRERFNAGLEARVNERTRIARELHDTLLQSFNGILLRFQAASNLLPTRPEEAKNKLGAAIEQASQAVAEGRGTVQTLRASTAAGNDLAVAIRTLGEELASSCTNEECAEFDVAVEGMPRDLRPIVRDELYRIACEAMRNAFRHAQATRIEVQLHYDPRELRLTVRDDGKGIESRVVEEEGRTGHFGLHGMRERARIIGARLELWSKVSAGTEVELTMPASHAYETRPRESSRVAAKEV